MRKKYSSLAEVHRQGVGSDQMSGELGGNHATIVRTLADDRGHAKPPDLQIRHV